MSDSAERAGWARNPRAPEPIVDGDHHDALLGQVLPVVDPHRTGPGDEAAAVDPHHHREALARRRRRRPDVQIEAVLALLPYIKVELSRVLGLRTRRAKGRAGPGLPPRSDGLRRLPAQLAHRRGGIGDALEVPDPVLRAPVMGPLSRPTFSSDALAPPQAASRPAAAQRPSSTSATSKMRRFTTHLLRLAGGSTACAVGRFSGLPAP